MKERPEDVKLEAPGAGLPFLDSLLMRFYVGPFVSKRGTVEENWKRFDRINKKIMEMVQPLSFEQIHKKILVPKLKGIEDSSRFWSVAETLEHIEMVGDSVCEGIEFLQNGIVPEKAANVAEYKPKGKYNGVDPRPAFEAFNKRIQDRLKGKKISLDPPFYRHPWLGMLSSQQWQWLLSGHSGIHYNQIKHILKQL